MTGLVSQSNAQRFRKVKWPVKVRQREPVARTPSQPSRAAHFCSQEEQTPHLAKLPTEDMPFLTQFLLTAIKLKTNS